MGIHKVNKDKYNVNARSKMGSKDYIYNSETDENEKYKLRIKKWSQK